jgi:hypothetical protein
MSGRLRGCAAAASERASGSKANLDGDQQTNGSRQRMPAQAAQAALPTGGISDMSKRSRKKRDRKKSGANHGKRPNT